MKNKKLLLAILSILISSSISYSDKYKLEYLALKDLDNKSFLNRPYNMDYMEHAKQILESSGILSKNKQDVIDKYSDFFNHYKEKYENVEISTSTNIFKIDPYKSVEDQFKNISAISNKILSKEELEKIEDFFETSLSSAANPRSLSDFKENLDFFYETYEKVLEYDKENKKLFNEISEDTRNKYNDYIKDNDYVQHYYNEPTMYNIEKFIRTLPESEANKIRKIVENNRKILERLVVFKASGHYDYKEFFDVNNMPEKEAVDELLKHYTSHNLTVGGKNQNFGENTSIFGVGNIVEKSGSNVYGDRNKLISNTDTKLVGSDNTIYGEKILY